MIKFSQPSQRKKSNNMLPTVLSTFLIRRGYETLGLSLVFIASLCAISIISYTPGDPSLNIATRGYPQNLAGHSGAIISDLALQLSGLATIIPIVILFIWGVRFCKKSLFNRLWLKLILAIFSLISGAVALASIPTPLWWPFVFGLGGNLGDIFFTLGKNNLFSLIIDNSNYFIRISTGIFSVLCCIAALGFSLQQWFRFFDLLSNWILIQTRRTIATFKILKSWLKIYLFGIHTDSLESPSLDKTKKSKSINKQVKADVLVTPKKFTKRGKKALLGRQRNLPLEPNEVFETPILELLELSEKIKINGQENQSTLKQNARYLASVLDEYGVKGEVVKVWPGPVVTLYELEPAPGTKTSRVIGLADDIARSMSAASVRIAVVPGRNAIGIEIPNQSREMVRLRELLASENFEKSKADLPLALGKDISGAPITVDLGRMPHLLIAGTTGSGKSVAMNTMILSLLYNLDPDRCKFIMIDPKMLELSVYEDIPHLLTPVVTDPSKAVVALKWVVREMEDRYRSMSQLGVRNIAGYNAKISKAAMAGETLSRIVQTGFDELGKPVLVEQPLSSDPLPFIVVVVDEMADLMLVAGKDVEAAIQRLAQMARAAGIHLMMATQRPSVDVITGTIKANFPSRISFQVTSKIDSRTILGEQGAEQLLGQGDMLYMAGGGRISRVHGPFVSDSEVEKVVGFIKSQGAPNYIEEVTSADAINLSFENSANKNSIDALYDEAVGIVLREGKASTSFIQRHLQIGYNRAARIIEQMETEGVVSAANRVGRREVLVNNQ